MKVLRKIIEIDEEKCDGCGQCVIACAEGALEIIDGKAKLVSENYCDGLGACIGECPQGAITIVEREAEDFDPEAVEEYLKKTGKHKVAHDAGPVHGISCPSATMQTFTSGNLQNWPVKLKLVNPNAPFFKGSDLLIAADCAPVVCSDFQTHFLPGKVVVIGCPKFDDINEYLAKLTAIFKGSNVNSIKILRMEVPCCSGLTGLIKKALKDANVDIPCEEVVLRSNGTILDKKPINNVA